MAFRMHYPEDPNTFAIETQFFYGPSLMVNPVTQEDASSVSFYVPDGIWYDLFTRKRVNGTGTTMTYSDVPASGTLYLDDGENLEQSGTSEITFTLAGMTLKAEGTFGFPIAIQIQSVTIMGSDDAATYDLNKGFDGGWTVDVGSLKKL